MKKVRLLCLLALLFAVGSAFTKTKFEKSIFRVDDGNGEFHWVEEEPTTGDCDPVISQPCSYLIENEADIPEPNTEPNPEDVVEPSGQLGAYP